MAFSGNTARNAAVIVPDDKAQVNFQAIHVGGAGVVAVEMAGGGNVPFTCVAGSTLSGHVVKVLSTGTTATLLVGWSD